MIKRSLYLDKIIPFIDKNIIKVLTGVRRSGKTILLKQIIEHLSSKGITNDYIIEINFESAKYDYLTEYKALYNYIIDIVKEDKNKYYIFLDEIQMVDHWEKIVASLMVDINCDIYITGSNSKLLSGELATLIAGRYVQIPVYPFTLSEAKQITMANNTYTNDFELFQDYLEYGGLPQRFSFENESLITYLTDTFEAIVFKDIIKRNNIKDSNMLSLVISFLMDNIGNTFSGRSVASTLTSNGKKTTTENVLKFIEYIENSKLINIVKRYDIKGKKLLENKEKYYSVDLGLRNIIKASPMIDYSKLYENIVFLELLARGYRVNVGKTDEYEIDFIAYKNKEIIYIQVAYLLASSETIEREFGNLEKIEDNYPKYVISGDVHDFSRNGIIHKNIIKFLLEK